MTVYPKPQTPDPKPQTPNPKPQTLNPKPCRGSLLVLEVHMHFADGETFGVYGEILPAQTARQGLGLGLGFRGVGV